MNSVLGSFVFWKAYLPNFLTKKLGDISFKIMLELLQWGRGYWIYRCMKGEKSQFDRLLWERDKLSRRRSDATQAYRYIMASEYISIWSWIFADSSSNRFQGVHGENVSLCVMLQPLRVPWVALEYARQTQRNIYIRPRWDSFECAGICQHKLSTPW